MILNDVSNFGLPKRSLESSRFIRITASGLKRNRWRKNKQKMSRISNLRLLTSHHLLSLEFSPFFEAVSPVPLLVEAEAPLETNGVSNWCDTQISFGSLDNPFGSRGNRPKMSMGASEEAKLWRLLSSNPLRPDFLGLSNLNFNFGSWSWPEIES